MRSIIGRLLLFAAALAGLSILVFATLRILPGDVAVVMAGADAPASRVARLRAELGLDRSYVAQYLDWAKGLLHGDLGSSALTGQAITGRVASRAAVTMPLILMALAVAVAFGVPLGCACVLSSSRRMRAALHMLAVVGGAVPALWSGLLLLLLFGRGVGLFGVLPSQGFPDAGWSGAPGESFRALLLPALAAGLVSGAGVMRHTRAALEEVCEVEGPVDMAMACGMTRASATLRVGLRLALPRLVSVIGLTFATMVTGVMVVENLYALPGLGALLVGDVGQRDLTAVQSELFLLAAFFLVMGLCVDLLHRLLDPRLANGEELV